MIISAVFSSPPVLCFLSADFLFLHFPAAFNILTAVSKDGKLQSSSGKCCNKALLGLFFENNWFIGFFSFPFFPFKMAAHLMQPRVWGLEKFLHSEYVNISCKNQAIDPILNKEGCHISLMELFPPLDSTLTVLFTDCIMKEYCVQGAICPLGCVGFCFVVHL